MSVCSSSTDCYISCIEATSYTVQPPMSLRIPGDYIVGQGTNGDAMRNTLSPPPSSALGGEIKRNVMATSLNRTNITNDSAGFAQNVGSIFYEWEILAKANEHQAWKDVWQSSGKTSHSMENRQGFYQTKANTPFWRDYATGCLATFKDLRDIPKGFQSGYLPPGTQVHLLELHELLEKPLSSMSTASPCSRILLPILGRNNAPKPLPWNFSQPGQILVAKYRLDQGSLSFSVRDKCVGEGYCIYSVDGYSFLYPGSLQDYTKNYMDKWYWRVTSPRGAYPVEEDRSTNTDSTILRYGSLVQVLNRRQEQCSNKAHLQVEACLWDVETKSYKLVQGWYQESDMFCDKLKALQPLPLAVPIIFQVKIPDGQIVERKKEMHSEKCYFLSFNGLVSVTERAYTRVHRRKQEFDLIRWLAAGCGWFSKYCQDSYYYGNLVAIPLCLDASFNPFSPETYHYRMVCETIQVDMTDERHRMIAKKLAASWPTPPETAPAVEDPSRIFRVIDNMGKANVETVSRVKSNDTTRTSCSSRSETSREPSVLSIDQLRDELSEYSFLSSKSLPLESNDNEGSAHSPFLTNTPIFSPTPNSKPNSLHFAVANGDAVEFQFELRRAIRDDTINDIDAHSRTALDVAALTGQDKFYFQLVEAGAQSCQFYGHEHALTRLVYDETRDSRGWREEILIQYNNILSSKSTTAVEEAPKADAAIPIIQYTNCVSDGFPLEEEEEEGNDNSCLLSVIEDFNSSFDSSHLEEEEDGDDGSSSWFSIQDSNFSSNSLPLVEEETEGDDYSCEWSEPSPLSVSWACEGAFLQ